MPFFGVPIRNGLPIGLGSVAGFGVQQFDPLELFASGAEGVWYDPSDTSTLFQDPAGTTPVTAVEQPVGLMLDKSKGLVLGSELVTNGDFGGGSTGWTLGVGWSVAGGVATHAAGTSSAINQTGGITAGRTYVCTITVSGRTSGSWYWRLGNTTNLEISSSNGTFTKYITGTATGNYIGIFGDATFDGSIDNISVRELPGNHAISYNSTTARPTLSARVNLLTKTEEFDDGVVWNNTRSSDAANVAVAPDGTLTADKLIANTDNATHFVVQSLVLSTITYTFSVYAKAAEYSGLRLFWTEGVNPNASFDLLAGTVTSSGTGVTATITDAGNGWYRCTYTKTNAGAASNPQINVGSDGTTFSFVGDNVSGIYLWGADLRVSNIGSAVPSYQRIAAATDYDTNGFPKYLYFAGTDDGMSTPANLNLTSTDKVTVFSGVRKLSDAVAGVLTELSAAVASNNGAFAIVAPTSVVANSYNWVSRGTLGVDNAVVNAFTAPVTGVITGIADIAAPVSTNRLSGAVLQTLTTSQGTGNYGSYPLYIGSRNNASAWFNGYLYGLTVVGAQLTTPQIESMETWTAGKTGITL